MSHFNQVVAVACTLFFFINPAFAQQPSAEHFESALAAKERGDFEEALKHLERAQLAEAKPQHIYHRVLVLEAMGEAQLALDVLEEHRNEMAGAAGVDDLAVLEQRLQDRAQNQADEHASGDTDVLGWSLVGGGAVLVGGGVASLFIAEAEADRLRCSPLSSADKSGCDGVEAHQQLSQSEFDSKRGDVTLYRAVGAGLSAVGVVSLGWGLYRLLDNEHPAQTALRDDGPTLRTTVTGGGRLGVELQYRF